MLFALPLSASFLPLDYEVDLKSLPQGEPNMTKAEFDELIRDVSEKHKAIVSEHGGRLSIAGRWNEEKPNARATQMFGMWRIEITGGLARRPELSQDGFTLILCHELGHHLGGFAFAPLAPVPIPVPTPGIDVWAAVEGQSDYYATHVCPERVWGEEKAKNAEFRRTASQEVRSLCDSVWQDADRQNLCYRTLVATESMIATMATLMKRDMPSFSTPDPAEVDKTSPKHPDVQCRMDTSLQGALCTLDFDDSVIPGKKVSSGPDSVDAEKEAYQYTCSRSDNYTIGIRPRCWYKNRL